MSRPLSPHGAYARSLGITREYWKMTNEEAATAILAFQQISQPFDGDVPDITDPFADQ